jgi:ATP-dependent helicase HrpA
MRAGVRRLLLLSLERSRRNIERGLDRAGRLAVAAWGAPFDALVDDCLAAAVEAVLAHGDTDELPWDRDAFRSLQEEVRARAPAIAIDTLRDAADVLGVATRVRQKLDVLVAPALDASFHDASVHLGRLVQPGFAAASGVDRLRDVQRYVEAIDYRLERVATDVGRDRRRMAEVRPLEERYRALAASFGRRPVPPAVREVGWALEELRISLFAQELGARASTSAKRVAKLLDDLGA